MSKHQIEALEFTYHTDPGSLEAKVSFTPSPPPDRVGLHPSLWESLLSQPLPWLSAKVTREPDVVEADGVRLPGKLRAAELTFTGVEGTAVYSVVEETADLVTLQRDSWTPKAELATVVHEGELLDESPKPRPS